MKLRIYMTAEGLENLATAKEPWPWHFSMRTGTMEPEANSLLLAETEVELPNREACIPPVLAMLKAREQTLQADVHEDLRALAQRRENLLALTYAGE